MILDNLTKILLTYWKKRKYLIGKQNVKIELLK